MRSSMGGRRGDEAFPGFGRVRRPSPRQGPVPRGPRPPTDPRSNPEGPTRRSLRVLRRVTVERRLAAGGAEDIRLASEDGAACGPLRVHHHPAHRILFHSVTSSVLDRIGQIRGLKRRRVIEFITTETELKPIAPPAMIGFSTNLRPRIAPVAKIPAARGIRAVL